MVDGQGKAAREKLFLGGRVVWGGGTSPQLPLMMNQWVWRTKEVLSEGGCGCFGGRVLQNQRGSLEHGYNGPRIQHILGQYSGDGVA